MTCRFLLELKLPQVWENGYPDCPEMDNFRVGVKQFMLEWAAMESSVMGSCAALDIREKTPEDSLRESVAVMESEHALRVCLPVCLW